jgi:hypothetical protein
MAMRMLIKVMREGASQVTEKQNATNHNVPAALQVKNMTG